MSKSDAKREEIRKAYRGLNARDAELRQRRLENLDRFNKHVAQRGALGNTGERPHWDNPVVIGDHRRHRS